MKSERGKYVSRAAFAKMQGERDRLKKALYVITMGGKEKGLAVFKEWRQKFLEEKWLNDALKEYAMKELPRMAEQYPFLKELLNKEPDVQESDTTTAK